MRQRGRSRSLAARNKTMAWFKKIEGEDLMLTNNSSAAGRPEPREPRPEPRAPQARPAEPRPEARSAEVIKAPEARPVETVPRASVLGPTLKFRGELSAQEDLVVQGSVEGSITHTQSLTIGTDGSMKGDIRARLIVIDGKVEGDLYATESVSIRATAKVKGNLYAPRVSISEGAFFQGQIDMQPTGAAVQEQSAKLRAAALASSPPPLEAPQIDKVLSGT